MPPPARPQRPASLLVACYPFPGSVTHAARHGVVQWNDRGQCMVMTNKEVVVLTPHTPNASTAKHASLRPPAPPAIPLIFDNTIEVLPSVPPTHSILPLHVSRIPIAPWGWSGHAPTPDVQATWDAQGGWDGATARREISARLSESMGRRMGVGGGPKDAETIYEPTRKGEIKANDLNAYYPPSAPAFRAFAVSPQGMPDGNGTGAPWVVVLDNMLGVSVRRAERGDVVSAEWEMSADLTREAFLLDAPSGFAAPQPKTRAKPGPPAKGTQIGEIADDVEEAAGQPRRKRAKVDTSLTEKARDKGPKQTNNRESSPEIEIVGTSTRDARSQKTELQLELALQTMCIAWSAAPAFAEPYGQMAEASLLALGNRGGGISIWSVEARAARPAGMSGLIRIWSEQVGNAIVSHLAWSPWVQVGATGVAAILAWATSDGQAHWMRIRREMRRDGLVTTDIGAKSSGEGVDARPVNDLGWAHGCLIAIKTSAVLVFKDVETRRSVAPNVIRLHQRGDWAGCAASSPCGGIVALPSRLIMIIATSGEVHILRGIGPDETTAIDEFTSLRWQSAVRDALIDAVATDKVRVARESSVRLQGCAGLFCEAAGGAFLLGFVFEPMHHHNLSVEREATRSHYLCLMDCSALLNTATGDAEQGEIHPAGEQNGSHQASRPPTAVQAHHPLSEMTSLLPALYRSKARKNPPTWTFLRPSSDTGVSGRDTNPFTGIQSRLHLLARLRWELANNPALMAQRKGTMWKLWTDLMGIEHQAPPGSKYRPMLAGLQDVLRTNLLFVSAASRLYPADPSNVAFVSRLLCALDIYRDLELDEVLRAEKAMLTLREDNPPHEECLFCHDELLLERTDGSTMKQSCEQGHVWTRCSVTWRLLTTPHVRSCAVCNLKASIPLPPGHRTEYPSFEQDALNAATCCAVCGGPWLQLV